jgi:hypothetical protein
MMANAWLAASANAIVETLLQVPRSLSLCVRSCCGDVIGMEPDQSLQGFPYEEQTLKIDLGSFIATLNYPLIMSWLLPVYVYNIVLEKQEKLREMMKMVPHLKPSL